MVRGELCGLVNCGAIRKQNNMSIPVSLIAVEELCPAQVRSSLPARLGLVIGLRLDSKCKLPGSESCSSAMMSGSPSVVVNSSSAFVDKVLLSTGGGHLERFPFSPRFVLDCELELLQQ